MQLGDQDEVIAMLKALRDQMRYAALRSLWIPALPNPPPGDSLMNSQNIALSSHQSTLQKQAWTKLHDADEPQQDYFACELQPNCTTDITPLG